MSEGSWRREARAAIDSALAEANRRGLDGAELVRFVRAAYPFGPRKYHPYKIWLSEVKAQLAGRRKAAGWPGLTPKQRAAFGLGAGPDPDGGAGCTNQ